MKLSLSLQIFIFCYCVLNSVLVLGDLMHNFNNDAASPGCFAEKCRNLRPPPRHPRFRAPSFNPRQHISMWKRYSSFRKPEGETEGPGCDKFKDCLCRCILQGELTPMQCHSVC